MAGLLFGRIASAARRLWRRSSTPPPGRESSARVLKVAEIVAKEESGERWSSRAPTLAVLVYLGVSYSDKVEALKVEKHRNASLEVENEKLKAKAASAEGEIAKKDHKWWKILKFWE